MCKNNFELSGAKTLQPAAQANEKSKKKFSRTTISAVVVAVFIVLVPALISEAIGGWTAKYTSPSPIFTKKAIQDLTGQVAIVTGANSGIGYHTALELARNGATVIVAARNPIRGEAAVEKIQNEIDLKEEESRIQFLQLDLSSLQSVKTFATSFKKLKMPLNMLVLNAGIMKSPGAQFMGQNMTYGFGTTVNGFESHIGVNHIGHFYLTKLLTSTLKSSSPSRVVSVSSLAEEGAYPADGVRFSTWKPTTSNGDVPADYEDGIAYGQSKLSNLLFAKEFASRLEGTGVTAYSCHPGVIITDLANDMDAYMKKNAGGYFAGLMNAAFSKWFAMSNMNAADGALTQLHLTTADPSKLVNGAHYHPIGRVLEGSRHAQGRNETLQKLVWTETERMIKQAGF
eukprot:CAMPEP_0194121416 /NCGR_PEP_ID=MMETSP0150-20130528/46998_1 /TAXON_ID=122233 /ORGANISM="Chaetoceros debilis, Strain MM31A-1" /LENGTH=398 /DNA_ID=CAMNT_0038813845 /DNA_START=134 /DNA_END=1330 /DNA_ORIENTATION=-